MRPDPYKAPGWSAQSKFHPQAVRLIRVVGFLLAMGFFCTSLAAGLMQFVMIGLLGLGLIPVAFGLLLAAGTLARGGHQPWWQQIASLSFHCIAVLSLIAIASYGTSLAYGQALAPRGGIPDPTLLQWAFLMLVSFLSAVAVSIALLFRTGWSRSRCFAWGIAAFAVSPTAILIFWILKLTGQPLTA